MFVGPNGKSVMCGNQANEIGELKNQFGEMVEFMGKIQEQSELSNSTIVNSTGDFETAKAITLGSSMEVEDEPKTSNPSQNMDEQLLQEEEEMDKATAREEHPLSQPPKDPTPPNSSMVVPNSILSNLIPPNALLAGSCNPRKKIVSKTSWKPFQRCKLISRFLN